MSEKYSAKKWPQVPTSKRKIDANGDSYGEIMKRDNAVGDDLISLFMWDSEDCKSEEVTAFLQGASLKGLEAGADTAGHERNAWIYDKSSAVFSLEEEGELSAGATTATGLHRRLLQPRSQGQSSSKADIRLVHIQNLDPYSFIALGSTVSGPQVPLLRDAFWKHLTLQTSIRIKIPVRIFNSTGVGQLKLGIFHMEAHIPYFRLRRRPIQEKSSPDQVNKKFQREWTDLSFLNIIPPPAKPDDTEEKLSYGLFEAHMAFAICGSNESCWDGYSLVDTDPDDDQTLEEIVSPEETTGVHVDPISRDVLLQGALGITDPREYFLIVHQVRINDIYREWELIVRKFELAIRTHQRENLSLLSKDSLHTGHQAEDVKKTFDWNQQTMVVLDQLLDGLTQNINAWEIFASKNGDIEYFSDIEPSAGDSHSRVQESFQAIKESFENLGVLKDKLGLLAKTCRKAAEALLLRLTLEANEAVRNNGLFTQFTVSIISPVMAAIAYYSIPPTSAPFKLEAKYFTLAIILIGVLVQLLFVAFSHRSWKKATALAQSLRTNLGNYPGILMRERKKSDECVGDTGGGTV